MRIVIDLQSCQQHGGAAPIGASLALAQQLARSAGDHELWIACRYPSPAPIAALRAAFDGLLPRNRFVVYATLAPDGTLLARRMAELIRDNFFLALEADIVFAPDWRPGEGVGAPRTDGFLFAAGLTGTAPPQHAGLAHASLLLATSEALAASLRAADPERDRSIVCIGEDPVTAAPLAWHAFQQVLAARLSTSLPPARARLALLSPLDAQQPEIGAQTAALAAQLARHYDIDLVVDTGAALDPPPADVTLRTIDWFETNAAGCERLVYQFGNSSAHHYLFDLFARHPGIVVLHDFGLGHVIDSVTARHNDLQAFGKTMFASHGYSGLLDATRLGRTAAVAKYPLNKTVLDLASGVIVHAGGARQLGECWYGPGSTRRWRTIALPPAMTPRHRPLPENAGCPYRDAIEAFSLASPHARYRQLLAAIGHLAAPTDPRTPLLLSAAKAIASNQPGRPQRQLLVDISALVETDLKTGIQRVVRSIVLALIEAPPAGFRVEPVYGNGGQRRYRYARKFTCAMLGMADLGLEDAPIEHGPDDIFLGLDLAAHCTMQNQRLLTEMREHGIALYFVVYDLLPMLMPDAFPFGTAQPFSEYIHTVSSLADGLVCISRSVADELCTWLAEHPVPRSTPLRLAYFHLGADIDASAPSFGMSQDAAQVFAAMHTRPTLLMVGTLEPRKGHAQALLAFESLWSQQREVNLLIVGKEGWLVDQLAKDLQRHPHLNERLFWLRGASDEMLGRLYARASGLLAASFGEGFGLPLIEAAQHNLPIIARNLTVFREVGGDHALYFEATTAQQMADALGAWFDLFARGQVPPSGGMRWLTWAESAQQLLACVVGQQWYQTLPDAPPVRALGPHAEPVAPAC